MNKIIPILLTVLVAGCSSIEHSKKIEQATNTPLFAGAGDVVIHINHERDLENAYGNADIFGRKTKEGFSELRFIGVDKNGDTILARKDVNILSNETTLSRNPFSYTTAESNTTSTGVYSGNNTGGTISGNSNTTYNSTTMSPTSDYHMAIPSDSTPIKLNSSERTLPIDGYVIEIIKATPNSLQYKIR